MLCHDREKDSCSQGLLDAKTGGDQEEPPRRGARRAARSRRRSARCTRCGRRASSSPRWPSSRSTTRCARAPGHRICNDCMKACIFQKQEPVNIPQVETRVLTETLDLPWGLEIYQLLTRWNPLNVERPAMRAVQRQERARRRPRPGGVHAGAPPGVRRLRRRRGRRVEGRAARPAGSWPHGDRAIARSKTATRALRRAAASGDFSASAASASTGSRFAGTRTSSRWST